jgi:hypothetical protein
MRLPFYAATANRFQLVWFECEGDRYFALTNGVEFLKLDWRQCWQDFDAFAKEFREHYRMAAETEIEKQLQGFQELVEAGSPALKL